MDLGSLQKQLNELSDQLPPVDKWNPDFCGDMDIKIKHDGSWFYMGTPIGRKSLVKLFSSVLKREDDDYFLVTPVEKIGIQVVDSPFVITQWHIQDKRLVFTTQTDENILVSADNPVILQADLTTGDILPYILVRRNLWARLHQNVFYQLAELGQQRQFEGDNHLLVNSADYAFSLGKL
ncbi:MAG: hypothetical protein ACI808_002710 [Paraglaciecola sp.]|jgi:hypothetical protein